MNKTGPIVFIADDLDDQFLFSEVLRELGVENEILFFNNGIDALEHLTEDSLNPFLIISDINLPRLTGLALREKIHNNEKLALKCVPYLFFTTSSNHLDIIEAYSKSVQGFFIKPAPFADLKRILHNIVEYWKDCQAPDIAKLPLNKS